MSAPFSIPFAGDGGNEGQEGEEEQERVENVEEFISGVIEYEKNTEEPSLVGFLEENALVADVDKYDEEADAVVMMTIHSAKGLEFPVVFLPGMEETVFPTSQCVNSFDQEDMEEERRLAYVAITRAKDALFMTYTRERMLYGRTGSNLPSRFLQDIPQKLCVADEFDGSVPQPRVKVYFSESADRDFGGSHARYSTYGARNARDSRPASFAGAADPTPRKPAGNLTLKAGDRVFHVTFGEGEILSARPMGSDVLYEVIFDRVGTKKLMGTYARLKKL
ncbi:MAG: ATP-binding domain-containing protein [Clostridia bacterium]|nr:ATP-binding domain-containing protein [Clostridia bacterium]